MKAGTPGAAGPFNCNGYTNGAATLVVPPGSTVMMNFENLDGTPHSAALIAHAVADVFLVIGILRVHPSLRQAFRRAYQE